MRSPSRSLFSIHTFWIIVLLFGVYDRGVTAGDGSGDAWLWCLANTALLPIFGLGLVATEQFVVVAVARALGDRAVLVWIGEGPTLIESAVRDVNVVVRVLPMFGGNLILSTERRRQRLRTAIAQGAGTAVLACIMIAIVVGGRVTWPELKHHLSTGIAPDSLAVVGVGIAIVYGIGGGTHAIASTEQKLLARRMLALSFVAAKHLSRGAYVEAERLTRLGLVEKPDDPQLQLMLATALTCRLQHDEAFAVVDAMRGRELPDALKKLCGSIWAWICYASDRHSCRKEAEAAAREAVAAFPDNAGLMDTLGHVLMWNGNFTEAERCLRGAYKNAVAYDRDSTRASAAAGLAMVYAKRDDLDEATRWLATARQCARHEELVARAAALVEPLRRT
jgi:hypothetical protein